MEVRNVPSGSFMGNQLQPLEGLPCLHCSPHPCQPPPTGSGKLPDQRPSADVMVDHIGECRNMKHEGSLAQLFIHFVAIDRFINLGIVIKSV